jgi:hypothetical protein
MNIADEKNRLKNEIDNVSNPDTLRRISAIISNDEGSLLTDEQLAIVMEEREKYVKDPSSLIKLEDFKANIKKKYGFSFLCY